MAEEAKIEGQPTFKTVPFVLMAIVFACAIFVGILSHIIKPGLISGIGLACFVALLHWVGLVAAIKAKATSAAMIIGMFASFWSFLALSFICIGQGWSSPEAMDSILLMIEPSMIIVISVIAIGSYKGNLRWILLLGLNGAIASLWIPKISKAMGYLTDDGKIFWSAFAGWWIGLLGVWAILSILIELYGKKVLAEARAPTIERSASASDSEIVSG